MKVSYVALFTHYKEDDSYGVEFPDLSGCATGGKNLIEAIEMAEDAAAGWLLGELEQEKKLPIAQNIKDIQIDDENSFLNITVIDLEAYMEKYSKKSVRKNITIPAWLNAFAEKEHLNFSKILQDALFAKMQS